MIFFFSFSDLYPSVSPSWLSSVESLSPLFLNRPHDRQNQRTESHKFDKFYNHILTLLGHHQTNQIDVDELTRTQQKKSFWWKTFSWELKMKVCWTSTLCFDFLSMSHTHAKLWVINDESHKFSLASVALVRYLNPVRFLGDFLFAKKRFGRVRTRIKC